jgi:hypothetical protein
LPTGRGWRLALVALWFFVAAVAVASVSVAADSAAEGGSTVRSAEDGALDVSDFLDKSYGFLPLLIPITEPAVGYGAAGGLLFIDRPQGERRPGFDRPNLTAVAGLATENGTRGILGGDVRHWGDDRVRTMIGGIYASFHLDYFGSGQDGTLNDHPVTYTLEPLGGGVQARYRFGASRLSAGLGYALADTVITYDDSASPTSLTGLPDRSRVGGMTPSLTFDSRDNIFTPIRGSYAEGTAGVFSPALGGDDTFQRVNLVYIHYAALHPKVTLGVKGSATFSFGEVPFYMLPYVSLRGAPILRYQGEEAADVETEVRWQFCRRFSVVGFVGGGSAWNDFQRLDDRTSILTGGTGFRYELARRYGLHAGLDVAFGPGETAIYIQVGSAWARP